jgi:hypothetical protein
MATARMTSPSTRSTCASGRRTDRRRHREHSARTGRGDLTAASLEVQAVPGVRIPSSPFQNPFRNGAPPPGASSGPSRGQTRRHRRHRDRQGTETDEEGRAASRWLSHPFAYRHSHRGEQEHRSRHRHQPEGSIQPEHGKAPQEDRAKEQNEIRRQDLVAWRGP